MQPRLKKSILATTIHKSKFIQDRKLTKVIPERLNMAWHSKTLQITIPNFNMQWLFYKQQFLPFEWHAMECKVSNNALYLSEFFSFPISSTCDISCKLDIAFIEKSNIISPFLTASQLATYSLC